MGVSAASGGKRNTRNIAAAAALILTTGVGTVAIGILRSDPAKAAGGACLTICALTFVALLILRHWITDTAAERERLADATKTAREERTSYVAAQAALDAERARVRRDAGLEAARLQQQLHADQEAMRRQFDADRHKVVCEAFEMGALLERSGMLGDADQQATVRHLFPPRPPASSGVSRPS